MRLNRVNARKEFFRTTPFVVMDLLEKLAGSHLMVFNETTEAAEWRISKGQLAQTKSTANGSTAALAPLRLRSRL